MSELVTNAINHAGTPVSVAIRADDEVTVVVCDAAAAMPVPTETARAASNATSGRGLQIVEAVSDSWGVSCGSGSKSIWFTLRLPDAADDADIVSLDQRRGARDRTMTDGATASRSTQARA